MTAIDARALTLKIGDGAEPENFTEVGGLQNHRISLRNNAAQHHHLDLTHSWEEANASTGRQKITLSGQGIFTDSASEEILRNQAFANSITNYQIALGNGDMVSGAFIIRDFERLANMEDAVQYNLSLQSAGEITFTASS